MVKTALALSGGGSKGAYTVGVLKHWIGDLDLRFEIVSGASTGALIAPMALLGEIDELEEVYTSVSSDDIYKVRTLSKILSTTSLVDTQPLARLIKRHLSDERCARLFAFADPRAMPRRLLVIGTYRLQDRKMVYFHTGPKSLRLSPPLPDVELISMRSAADRNDCLRRSILASCNQPALMPSIHVPKEETALQYVDGGVKEALPGAVCKALGAEKLRAVSLLAPRAGRTYDMKKKTRVFDVGTTTLTHMIQDSFDRSLSESKKCFAPSKFRLIQPATTLTKNMNLFSPRDMKRMLKLGYEQAQAEE